MRSKLLRAIAVVGLLGMLGAATQPALPDIDRFLRQLSSDNWATRQAAQQKLVQCGDSAEPALRAALQKSPDPETQSRIAEALREIDANRMTGPTIVTLDYDNADPQTILNDLRKQAHGQMELAATGWPGALHPISIHVHQQPFWIAMKQFCDSTGLSPRFDNGDSKMTLMPGGDFLNGIAQCDGPFMIVARRITENAELSLGPGQALRRTTSLELAVLAEPKLTLVGHAYMPQIDIATDDAGNSLRAEPGWRRFNPMIINSLNADDSRLWMLSIEMHRPDDRAKKIARLKGSVRTAIETRSETWTVPDILKIHDLSRQFGNSTFSIDSITQTQTIYMLRISATRLSASPNDPSLGVGQIDLLDAKGQPLTRRGLGGGGGMDRMMYTFTFDSSDPAHPAGEPAKLVWKVPTGTKMVDVPFEFRDLPLP